jgi:futalosine hydrolase
MPDGIESTLAPTGRLLVLVSTSIEARALLAHARHGDIPDIQTPTGDWMIIPVNRRSDLVLTGVGKANASAACARLLNPSHAGVLNIGVAGALPGSGLSLGEILLSTRSVYADEGLLTPDAFIDCESMGFPLGPFAGNAIPIHAPWLPALSPLAARAGPIATVSTCSGTDTLAESVANRTGALAEAMEGAAIGHVAARLGVPFAEIRAISNSTGNRSRQVWDMSAALGALARLGAALFGI